MKNEIKMYPIKEFQQMLKDFLENLCKTSIISRNWSLLRLGTRGNKKGYTKSFYFDW